MMNLGALTRCPACGGDVAVLTDPSMVSGERLGGPEVVVTVDGKDGPVVIGTYTVDVADVELHLLTECPARND